MTRQEILAIRGNFPILETKIYDKPLIYLDNAATVQKPLAVLEKISDGYTHFNGNIHRGVHWLSQKSTEAHEAARRKVADFVCATSEREIIFTRGTTEAINMVAFSFGEKYGKEGDEIIVSALEHHSNIVPWQMLCERKKMVLKVAPITDDGVIDIEGYKALLSTRTSLVAVAHISNVLGTVQPIAEIVRAAHQQGAKVLVDGAQASSHIPIDVQALDVDFYAFSGHKMYAPTGIGVLYGKEALLNELPPYQGGGEMIDKVSFEKTTYNVLPYKFEAGTPDYIGSTALGSAIDYIEEIGRECIWAYEEELLTYATSQLETIDGLVVYGDSRPKSAVISFNVGNIHHYDIGMLLDKLGIAVRTGHHCAQPLMDRLGVVGTVRASFAVYNTKEEIDIFVAGLKRVVTMLS